MHVYMLFKMDRGVLRFLQKLIQKLRLQRRFRDLKVTESTGDVADKRRWRGVGPPRADPSVSSKPCLLVVARELVLRFVCVAIAWAVLPVQRSRWL